jgi:hypothetical protein
VAATYDVGSIVRVKVAFTDLNLAPIDPATVTLAFTVYDQLGNVKNTVTNWTVTAGQIVKDSTGNYHADLDTSNKPGVWDYRYVGTAAGQAAVDGSFRVTDTPAR